MVKQKGRLTTGDKPGILVSERTTYKSLEEACGAAGVEKLLSYKRYCEQAPKFHIPPKQLPEDARNVYFGVDEGLHSLVFLERRDGLFEIEPACCLHTCEKEAIDHQIKTGKIVASGRKFVIPDMFHLAALGPTVQVGVPPIIREVALSDIGADGFDNRKSVLGVSFIHIIKPSPETEFVLRGSPITPDIPPAEAEAITRYWHENPRMPDICQCKLAKEINASDIAATIIAAPEALSPDPPYEVEKTQVGRDMAHYYEKIKSAHPGREVILARKSDELRQAYQRYWIHL